MLAHTLCTAWCLLTARMQAKFVRSLRNLTWDWFTNHRGIHQRSLLAVALVNHSSKELTIDDVELIQVSSLLPCQEIASSDAYYWAFSTDAYELEWFDLTKS